MSYKAYKQQMEYVEAKVLVKQLEEENKELKENPFDCHCGECKPIPTELKELRDENKELQDRYIELEKRNAELSAAGATMNGIADKRFRLNRTLYEIIDRLKKEIEDLQDELISIRGF